jgi:hypothetical protein
VFYLLPGRGIAGSGDCAGLDWAAAREATGETSTAAGSGVVAGRAEVTKSNRFDVVMIAVCEITFMSHLRYAISTAATLLIK